MYFFIFVDMAAPQWINEEGIPAAFAEVPARHHAGHRLAGTKLQQSKNGSHEILLQEWERSLYHIGCRIITFFKKIILNVKEKQQCLRIEAVVAGEFTSISATGQKTKMREGQYRLTDEPAYFLKGKKDHTCCYLVSYYPKELLEEFDYRNQSFNSGPLNMPDNLSLLIHELLHNPYEPNLHTIYYQNMIRDIFFLHLTAGKTELPSFISEADAAAVYKADAILSTDLSEHYSIPVLSAMSGTNAFKLKKGFRHIFNMGIFERLLFRRINHAKLLLETTSKPIKEVALEAGYASSSSFVNVFRKRFGMTPLDWREQQRR